MYPDSIFNKNGIPCGVFVVKTEDVDDKLPEYKQFAKEQKIKIILTSICDFSISKKRLNQALIIECLF